MPPAIPTATHPLHLRPPLPSVQVRKAREHRRKLHQEAAAGGGGGPAGGGDRPAGASWMGGGEWVSVGELQQGESLEEALAGVASGA